jgi:hypothetical protein
MRSSRPQVRTPSFARMFHVEPRRCSRGRAPEDLDARHRMFHVEPLAPCDGPAPAGPNALNRPTKGSEGRFSRTLRRCASAARHQVGTLATHRGVSRGTVKRRIRGLGSVPAFHSGRPQVGISSPIGTACRYTTVSARIDGACGCGCRRARGCGRCWPASCRRIRRRPRRAVGQRDRRTAAGLLRSTRRRTGPRGARGRAISLHGSVGEDTSDASRRTAGDA